MLSGNKGVIFTLDMAFAVIIAVIILSFSTYYIIKSDEGILNKGQINRVGSDITALLDHLGILDSTNQDIIRLGIQNNKISFYHYRLKIECDSGPNLESGENLPSNGFIGSGQRVFVRNRITTIDNCIAKYWVWVM